MIKLNQRIRWRQNYGWVLLPLHSLFQALRLSRKRKELRVKSEWGLGSRRGGRGALFTRSSFRFLDYLRAWKRLATSFNRGPGTCQIEMKFEMIVF